MNGTATKSAVVFSITVILLTALVPTVYADADDMTDDVVYEEGYPEYGLGPYGGFVVGLVVGLAIGYMVWGMDDPPSEPAVDDNEVRRTMSTLEAKRVVEAMDTAKNMIQSVLPADSDLWFFTQNYWDQAMEYQVYAYWTKNNEGFDSVANALLYQTGLLYNSSNYTYTWATAIDNAYNNLLSRSEFWTGTGDYQYTNGMEITLDWGSGELVSNSGTSAGVISVDTTQYVQAQNDVNVYIDASGQDVDNFNAEYSGMMYLFGTSNKVLRNIDTGQTITLYPGANDISSSTPGIYTLPAGATYAGPMVRVIGEGSVDVGGGMVMMQGSDIYLAIPTENDMEVEIISSTGNSVAVTDSISINVKTFGGEVESSILLGSENGNDFDIIGTYDDLIRQIDLVTSNTYIAGQTSWTIFDIAEESSPYVHPSSISINIPDHTLSMEERYMFYINAMAQIQDYYEANGGDLDGYELMVNVESLDLYCYGDIYVDGQLWMENAIFTPYISTNDQHLTVGTNVWSGSGFLTVWDQTENLNQWTGTPNTADSMMIPMEKNYVLEIKNITSHGKVVESVDLTRMVIQKYGTGSNDPDPPEPEPAMYSADILILLIIVELGMILFLIGRQIGSEIVMLIGIVVAIFGLVFPTAVSSLVLGTFEWSDLKPFGWL